MAVAANDGIQAADLGCHVGIYIIIHFHTFWISGEADVGQRQYNIIIRPQYRPIFPVLW